MTFLDPSLVSLSYLIRWLHVAAMAGLLGGAALLAVVSLRTWMAGDEHEGAMLVAVARTYEWIFWAAMGVLVMTGVGNLAAFGEGLPGPETDWGGVLVVKLAAVGVFGIASLVRSLLVVQLGETPERVGPTTIGVLGWAYAGTALIVMGIVGLAVWLAHR